MTYPPTSADINALPPDIRRWVHELESDADPAARAREAAAQRENAQALAARVRELEGGPRRPRAAVPDYLLSRQLTPTQRQVLDLVTRHASAGGEPSTVEIARELGVRRQSVVKTLHALERLGLIEDAPRVVRSGKWRPCT